MINHAKTVDFTPEKGDSERLQKWLESLDPDDMGKYKMSARAADPSTISSDFLILHGKRLIHGRTLPVPSSQRYR